MIVVNKKHVLKSCKELFTWLVVNTSATLKSVHSNELYTEVERNGNSLRVTSEGYKASSVTVSHPKYYRTGYHIPADLIHLESKLMKRTHISGITYAELRDNSELEQPLYDEEIIDLLSTTKCTGVYWYKHGAVTFGNARPELGIRQFANDSIFIPKQYFGERNMTTNKLAKALETVLASQLYKVSVQFRNSNKVYDYKSTVEFKVGDLVAVNSPVDGLTIVTVTGCTTGLDVDPGFGTYKWVIGKVDCAEYDRVVALETQLEKRLQAEAKLEEARKALADAGLTEAEVKAMVLGAPLS